MLAHACCPIHLALAGNGVAHQYVVVAGIPNMSARRQMAWGTTDIADSVPAGFAIGASDAAAHSVLAWILEWRNPGSDALGRLGPEHVADGRVIADIRRVHWSQRSYHP